MNYFPHVLLSFQVSKIDADDLVDPGYNFFGSSSFWADPVPNVKRS